jgi:hypothetical protein
MDEALQEIFQQVSADVARLGHAWRTIATYRAKEALSWHESIELEHTAAAKLSGDLASRTDLCVPAARTLLESLYADQYEDPIFWTSAVGQRVARVVRYPKSRVPANVVAAMTGFSRQRVWQLVKEQKLDACEEQGERIGLTAESVYAYMQTLPEAR